LRIPYIHKSPALIVIEKGEGGDNLSKGANAVKKANLYIIVVAWILSLVSTLAIVYVAQNFIHTQISDGAVTTTKISSGAVITAKLADGSVTSAKILDGTITATDISDGSIISVKVADGAVWNHNCNRHFRWLNHICQNC